MATARHFASHGASELSELGVTPEQCAVRTRDGGGGSVNTTTQGRQWLSDRSAGRGVHVVKPMSGVRSGFE